MNTSSSVGDLLRGWRERRNLTQLRLADLADISTRHVSFIETGRSLPSRTMLLRLTECLEVPLRERNVLMTAAGLAPIYPQRPLDDPAMALARATVERVLKGHEPYPALAVDRHWNLIAANKALAPMLEGAAAFLLQPPVNVLRLSLHPQGVAPRIVNLAEWREHVLQRLHHQVQGTHDPVLRALHEELSAYPRPEESSTVPAHGGDSALASFAVPLRLRTPHGELAFVSTTTVFGTPTDVTLAELAIESFFPADEATTRTLLAAALPEPSSG